MLTRRFLPPRPFSASKRRFFPSHRDFVGRRVRFGPRRGLLLPRVGSGGRKGSVSPRHGRRPWRRDGGSQSPKWRFPAQNGGWRRSSGTFVLPAPVSSRGGRWFLLVSPFFTLKQFFSTQNAAFCPRTDYRGLFGAAIFFFFCVTTKFFIPKHLFSAPKLFLTRQNRGFALLNGPKLDVFSPRTGSFCLSRDPSPQMRDFLPRKRLFCSPACLKRGLFDPKKTFFSPGMDFSTTKKQFLAPK